MAREVGEVGSFVKGIERLVFIVLILFFVLCVLFCGRGFY